MFSKQQEVEHYLHGNNNWIILTGAKVGCVGPTVQHLYPTEPDTSGTVVLDGRISTGSFSSEQPSCRSPACFSSSAPSARPESAPRPPGLRTAEPDSKPLCRTEPNPQDVLPTQQRLRADETIGLTCCLNSPACNRIPARFPRSTCWSGCPTERLRSTACWINDRASSW